MSEDSYERVTVTDMVKPKMIEFSLNFRVTPEELQEICSQLNDLAPGSEIMHHIWNLFDDVRIDEGVDAPENYLL